MWSLLSIAVPLLLTSACTDAVGLEKRQADSSKVTVTDFRRRAYTSVATFNNNAYIDGGEFSYVDSSNNIQYQYSDTLLSIDLTKDWTNSTVTLNPIAKPAGCPNLVSGGLWPDHIHNLIYMGFAGRPSNFGDNASQDIGLWSFNPENEKWLNMNTSADVAFTKNDRMFSPLVTFGGGVGYSLGGFVSEVMNPTYAAPGLLTFNYTSKDLENNTVSGTSEISGGYDQMGGLVHVQNFGEQGILVAVGGDKMVNMTDRFMDMSFATVYDIASGTWTDVSTSGQIPDGRKEFCTAGLANNHNQTFEILVYAGWGGQLGSEAVPFDEAFVLSLPSFNWFKAQYPASNPRHGVSCVPVGGAQVLTVGGVDTTQENGNAQGNFYMGPYDTADNFAQGLGVFDMNQMVFAPSFSADPADYTGAPAVLEYYGSHPRLPTAFPSAVSAILSHSSFPSTSSSSPTAASSRKLSNGAIPGLVVGSHIIIALIAIGGYLLYRRWAARPRTNRRRQDGLAELDTKEVSVSELSGDFGPDLYQYGHGSAMVSPLSGGGLVHEKQELPAHVPEQGGAVVPRIELPAENAVYELA